MNTPVVLITCALTGIGRPRPWPSLVKGRVVVSGRRDEVGQALASELRALGVEAEIINADERGSSKSGPPMFDNEFSE
jgi:hypothetical protein